MKILFIKFKFIKNSLKGLKTALFLDQKAPGGGVNPYDQPGCKPSGGVYDFHMARCEDCGPPLYVESKRRPSLHRSSHEVVKIEMSRTQHTEEGHSLHAWP